MTTSNKSHDNQCELSQLHEDIKSDLMTIPTLKLGIVSARDFYGSIGMALIKISLIFLGVNLSIQGVLYGLRLDRPLSIGTVFGTWIFALMGGFILMIGASQFVLFGKLVKGRLKTTAFIRKKCMHAVCAYLTLYSIGYLVISASLYALFGALSPTDWSAFDLGITQFACTVGSLIFTSGLISMEIERLGIGALFEVVQAFVAKVKNQPSLSNKLTNGEQE